MSPHPRHQSYLCVTTPLSKHRGRQSTLLKKLTETGLLLSQFSGSFLLRRVRFYQPGDVMDISVRSYLTAGVAVVGATAITLAPVKVLPADLEIRGENMASLLQDVSLSSLADLIAAAQQAIAPVGVGVEAGSIAAGAAIRDVGVAISETVAAGVAGGGTAFRAVLDALLAQGSSLAVAVDAAIAAFPSAEAFIDALVSAFASVDLDLSLALQLAFEAALDFGAVVNAEAIAEALLAAGADLVAAFNAAVENFPTPAAFASAVAAALSGVFPGLSDLVTDGGVALANLITTLAATLASGIDLSGSAFDILVAALQNGGSALAEAFADAIASFANPEAFVDAFIDILAAVNAPLAAAFNVALDIAVSLGIDLDVSAIVEALLTAGSDFSALLQAVVASFPTPGELVAAFGNALAGFLPGLQNLTSFAATAIANLSAALADIFGDGLAFGADVFGEIIAGLQDAGSQLYAAFAAAIAAFPTPQLFIDAFVNAFATISAPFGAALEVAFQAFIDGVEILNPVTIAEAFLNAGADLAGFFQSVLEGFPTPADVFAAFSSAFAAVIPGFEALAAAGVAALGDLSAALTAAIEAGIELGGTGFQALIDGLLDTNSALYAAFAAAIAAFPTPELFIDAFIDAFAAIDVSLGAALEVALEAFINGAEILNPVAVAEALINAGAELAATFGLVLDGFPTPAELVAAFADAFTSFVPGVEFIAAAAAEAIANLSADLAGVIEAGIGFGAQAFESLINGIEGISGDLAASFQAVLELFPSPELFVQALTNAFGQIGPFLADLGANLVAGIEAGIDLGAEAFAALGDISADISASISASLSLALDGLPDVVGAVGAVGEAIVDAAAYTGDTIRTAIDNFSSVATAVVVAFRDSTATAIANGQNSLEALVAGITAAAAKLAAGFNFSGSVDVDVDVEAGAGAGAGASSADVANSSGLGSGQLFTLSTPEAPAKTVTEETAVAAPVTPEEAVAGADEEKEPTAPANPFATAARDTQYTLNKVAEDTQHTLNNAGKQISAGLDQTRKQVEGGLNDLRNNVEKALGVKKPAKSDSKKDDTKADSAKSESKSDSKSESKSDSKKSDSKKSESKSDSKKSDSGE